MPVSLVTDGSNAVTFTGRPSAWIHEGLCSVLWICKVHTEIWSGLPDRSPKAL